MKFGIVAGLVAILAPVVSRAQDANAPLAPSGKWVVDYGTSTCLLSRDYGAGAAKVTLAFQPMPMSDMTDLMLVTSGDGGGFRSGKARVMIEKAGEPAIRDTEGVYRANRIPDKPSRLHAITIDREGLDGLDRATSLAIAMGKEPPIRLQARGMSTALSALATCQDTLLRAWGIDPREKDLVDKPARGVGPQYWVSVDDYPAAALAARQSGTVMIAWAIGIDGRVGDCRVLSSSGTPSLDQAACAAIVRRGRYRPAIGKDGTPIVTHVTRRVTWVLPQRN